MEQSGRGASIGLESNNKALRPTFQTKCYLSNNLEDEWVLALEKVSSRDKCCEEEMNAVVFRK